MDQERIGRRIYMHQDSMAHLASQSRVNAYAVFRAIAAMRINRVLLHHVIDDGLQLGYLEPATAGEIASSIRKKWGEQMTRLLRELWFLPREPKSYGKAQPVLVQSEEIVSSCSDSGYFTFATDVEASVRMFADTTPIHALRRMIIDTPNAEEIADLTIIRGRSLFRPERRDGKPYLGGHIAEVKRCTVDQAGLIHIQDEVAVEAIGELERFSEPFMVDSRENQVLVMSNAQRAARRVIELNRIRSFVTSMCRPPAAGSVEGQA